MGDQSDLFIALLGMNAQLAISRAALALALALAGCHAGTDSSSSVDGRVAGPDAEGTSSSNDGGVSPGGNDASLSGPCSPGAHECLGNVVGVCNSAGTSWLYEATCTDTCSAGVCSGACQPMATQCSGADVQQCNADGTSWTKTQTCANGCDEGTCVLTRLDVTSDMTLDGLVVVDGPVTIFAGATLTAPSGDLTIRAQSILVDTGGAIAVTATATGAPGAGQFQPARPYSDNPDYEDPACGGGGSHASMGGESEVDLQMEFGCEAVGGPVFGVSYDNAVDPGGPGGGVTSFSFNCGAGGGTLRLLAPTITVLGSVSANGGTCTDGYGDGAGGTVLIAADQLNASGTISAVGGAGNFEEIPNGDYLEGNGGDGFAKLFYGSQLQNTATIDGVSASSVSPPLALTSLTHPEQAKFYNDDFSTFALSWQRPFGSPQGYYWQIANYALSPPTAAGGTFSAVEGIAISREQLTSGTNYVGVTSIDPQSNTSTSEAVFALQLNTAPPTLDSLSNPSPGTWKTGNAPLVSWTLPHDDSNYRGVYYVLDHYGDTVPTAADTFVPVAQHQVLQSGIADGVWVMHVVSVDRVGHLTRAAAHYPLWLGSDPGEGRVLGQVTGPSGAVGSATIRFNRGVLADQTASSQGTYDLATVPAGTWDVTASAPGLAPQTMTVVVTAGSQLTLNFTLAP